MRCRYKRFGIFPLLCVLAAVYAGPVWAEPPPPVAWLDSLANFAQRESEISRVTLFQQDISQELNKEGRVEKSDTTYRIVEQTTEGNSVVWNSDASGNKKERKTDEKKSNTASLEVSVSGPLSPCLPENRGLYNFSALPAQNPGQMKISFQPKGKVKEGYSGSVVLDTTQWIPLRLEVVPIPLPKYCSEAHMNIDYTADSTNGAHVSRFEMTGKAKVLLVMTIRFRAISNILKYTVEK